MDTLRAEWKKFVTARELYAALALAAAITLWQGLSAGGRPEHFWQNLYNFNFSVAPVLILFLQAAGLSRLFCGERAERTAPLIRASRLGPGRTFRGKLALGLGYAAAASLLPGALVFCLGALGCGGVPVPPGGTGGIARVPHWEGRGALALWGWEMLFSLLGGLCAAGLVLLVSALARRPASAMAGSALCLSLPAALRAGALLVLSRLSPVPAGLAEVLSALYQLCGWSWSSILSYELLEAGGGSLWVPALYCLCLLAAELALVWLAWRRRDRR